ncbi:putative F-box domain-containing protein [Rosa chinensis]|uniref:Putative F-box domain-containing protein n=1 Tax=Rosa chinensis TaxID=74649 RepID=A0A2P6QSH9_ROSCH|nr:putative F-box protein At1g47790 [Rosa chinensis]PRQ37138.1 putative F-box domain-containing protein [Rosa chinensis]
MEDDSETTVLLNEIICSEILPRLPVKTLLRFRCVCKSWSSLILNPGFATAYRNLCSGERKRSHLLFFTCESEYQKEQRVFSVQLNQEGSQRRATHVLTLKQLYQAQSTKGLVCFSLSKTSSSYLEVLDNRVHIFNPSTRHVVTLPQTSRVNLTVYVAHHFGFSSLTNEHKVLQIQRYKRGLIFNTFVLGTSTTWRQVEVDLADLPFDPLEFKFDTSSVSTYGAIHWLHPTLNIIVAFDMNGAERFKVVPIPDGIDLHDPLVRLDKVDGCLALIDGRKQQSYMKGLWILKDYKNHVWVKEDILFPFQNDIVRGLADLRLHQYNMKTKSYRLSQILLPEWRNDSRMLDMLTSYDEGIVPLR